MSPADVLILSQGRGAGEGTVPPTAIRSQIGIGAPRGLSPPTPPDKRVRIRRFDELMLAELSVYDDTLYGREVLVRFTDETRLSIAVGMKQSIDARYCSEETPDKPIFVRQA